MAFNLAVERAFGGGFEAFRPASYLIYLPEVGARRTDAHSVYSELLGEHGFIGLGLFLAAGFAAYYSCRTVIARTLGEPALKWMHDLAAMLQVSLVGYAVSGAFLGLAYFDYYYALLALVVGMNVVLDDDATLEKGRAHPVAASAPQGPSANAGKGSSTAPTLRPGFPSFREARLFLLDWYRKL